MRKIMVCLFLLGIACQISSVRSSTGETRPLYSLAFHTSQGVYVATFMSDDTWDVDTLPRNAYFGQFDVMTCFPFWSADGSRLVIMLSSPSSLSEFEDVMQIGYYDILDRSFTTLLDPDMLPSTGRAFMDGYCIDSLSPDGRYVWLNSPISVQSVLFDLNTGTAVTVKPNLIQGAAWHGDRVYVSTADGLIQHDETEHEVLALPGGETLAAFPNYQDTAVQFTTNTFWLQDNRIVFTAYIPPYGPGYHFILGIADPETGTVEYVADDVFPYAPLRFSEDERYVAYEEMTNRHLVLLGLDTLDQVPTGVRSADYVWRGSTLTTLTAADDGSAIISEYEEQTRTVTQTLNLDGASPLKLSPDTQTILARSTEHSSLVLYRRDGSVLAGPEITTPEGAAVRMSAYDSKVVWGRTYAYLLTRAAQSDDSPLGSVAVNTQTGERLFSPDKYVWAGESPDGRWALLAGGTDDMAYSEYNYPELLVYSLETGETVTLFAVEGEVVYNPFHFSLTDMLRWSPG
jgi:hypothetical protein